MIELAMKIFLTRITNLYIENHSYTNWETDIELIRVQAVRIPVLFAKINFYCEKICFFFLNV